MGSRYWARTRSFQRFRYQICQGNFNPRWNDWTLKMWVFFLNFCPRVALPIWSAREGEDPLWLTPTDWYPLRRPPCATSRAETQGEDSFTFWGCHITSKKWMDPPCVSAHERRTRGVAQRISLPCSRIKSFYFSWDMPIQAVAPIWNQEYQYQRKSSTNFFSRKIKPGYPIWPIQLTH